MRETTRKKSCQRGTKSWQDLSTSLLENSTLTPPIELITLRNRCRKGKVLARKRFINQAVNSLMRPHTTGTTIKSHYRRNLMVNQEKSTSPLAILTLTPLTDLTTLKNQLKKGRTLVRKKPINQAENSLTKQHTLEITTRSHCQRGSRASQRQPTSLQAISTRTPRTS